VERYAVIRERGQVWDTSREMREQERWDEHAAFMEALVDEGLIVLGGPLGDGAQGFTSSRRAARRRSPNGWWPTRGSRWAS